MEEKLIKLMSDNFNIMNEKFEEMNQRFEEVNQRFEEVNQRFEEVNQRFEEVNQRFEEVNQRLDNHDKKFEELHSSIVIIEEYVTDKIPALFDGYKSNHQLYETLAERVEKIEEKENFNSLKILALENSVKENSNQISKLLS